VAELKRIHGPFVDDDEVRRVTDFLRAQGAPVYEADIRVENPDGTEEEPIEYDELYDEIVAWLVPQGKASTSMVQRQFKIGYNRAARVIEVMEKEGLVGPADGAKPRKILVGDCA
jgi:S-DNA-T family DNA segregation ATPase FtsK/SpoIIIE